MFRPIHAWLLCALVACQGDPQPCDTLCEGAGFNGIDETEAGCFCSNPDGLGGTLSEEDCTDYCAEVGTGGGRVEQDGEDVGCACGEVS